MAMLPVNCDLEVEDWFVQVVLDYTAQHNEYSYYTAFIFLHRRCFELRRVLEFHSMRGKTLLLLAQATGDYSMLTLWCEDGRLTKNAQDPDALKRGRVRVGRSGKTRASGGREYKTAV